ncbi:MAG: hypothetical protein INR73_03070 [Williamsia sp.]|nr:hypothetical protein [Williamsia sp.]
MIAAVKICLIFAGSLFVSSTGLCQSAMRLPFNKKISIDDGLSSYNVKKILQDKYGFVWIVTQDGLNRYDGKNFLVYNNSSEKDHQLLASDIWDVEEDSIRNLLWVVTSYGGLNAVNLITGKVSRTIPAKISQQGFSHEWLRCLRLCKNDLWIGTYDGFTIYNVEKQAYERFEPLPFKKEGNNAFCIDKFFIDPYGHIWLFVANYGIAIYSGETRKIISYYSLEKLLLENKPTFKQFNSVTLLPDGTVLAGTSQGFRRIVYTSTGIRTSSAGLFDDDTDYNRTGIEASGIDSSHHIWFSTSSKLFRVNTSHHTVMEVKDANIHLQNDWFNYIYDIFFDRNNNIWLGTRKGITYTRNTIPFFIPYYISADQTAMIDHAFYIYPYNDTVAYACTETGLLAVNSNTNEIVSLDKGRKYYFITEHTDKNMLVSSEDSFFVFRPHDKQFFKVALFIPS